MSLSTVISPKAWDEAHLLLHVMFLRGDSALLWWLDYFFFWAPSRNLNNHQTDIPIYCHLTQGLRWNPFVVACNFFKRGNHDWAIRFQVFFMFDNVSHFSNLLKFSVNSMLLLDMIFSPKPHHFRSSTKI